jgi:hypothetical protein
MKIINSEAVVLKSRPYGDSDILATLFTPSGGRGEFIFKGLLKSKKRELGASQPGAGLSFNYYYAENRQFYYIKEFTVNSHPLSNISTFEQSATAYYLLELILKTHGEDEGSRYAYNLLQKGLPILSQSEYPFHFSLFFTLHLLRNHGILPLNAGDIPEFFTAFSSHTRISTEHVQFYSMAVSEKFQNFNCTLFTEEDVQQFLFFLILYIEHYYTIDLKTKKTLFTKI